METLTAWIEAERGRFILWLPVAMASGILIYFDLAAEPPGWLGISLLAPALLGLAVFWRHPAARLMLALLVCGGLGFSRAQWRTAAQPPLMAIPYGAVVITGDIVAVDLLPNGRRITVDPAYLDATPVARAIHVKLRKTDATLLAPGAEITVRALLFKPDRPAYPGAWDPGRDAFFNGLGASGFAIGPVTVIAPPKYDGVAVWLRSLRETIAANILKVLPVDTGSVAVTLLTGFQQQMPAAERQDFIAAGLAHILAVAGLHVGIVMGLGFAVSRYLLTRHEGLSLRLPSKAIAAVIALAAGAFYAALTGAHLPILRSLAMASLVTLAVLADRQAVSLRGLALAALAILLLTPEAILGVSFQMSFSAVLALIAGHAAMRFWFYRLHAKNTHRHRTLGHATGLFYTSLLAGGASMPFAVFQFQEIQPYWILANLVAVPLTGLWVLPLGLVALALMPFGAAYLALVPMGWGIGVIVWLTRVIAAWPGAMLHIKPMGGLPILLIAFGLAWLCLWRSKPRFLGLAAMLAGLLAYSTDQPPDVLISADARLIALAGPLGAHPPEVLLFRQPKAAGFVVSQWQAVWNGAAFAAPDPLQCNAAFCRPPSRFNNVVVAIAPPFADCPDATLVVSPKPLHGVCDGAGRVVVDRFTVWRDGAIAAWVTANAVRLQTDRETQGSRPWVMPWPVSHWANNGEHDTTLN
jgi:competence protein ComEC